MSSYDFDGDSRSAHRTSAASMMTVNCPSGAIDKRALGSVVRRMNDKRRTLLDAVQNGFGEIRGRRLAVARHLCSPVDNM